MPPGTKVLIGEPVIGTEISGRQRIRRWFLWRKGSQFRAIEVSENVGQFSRIELWIDGGKVKFGRAKLSLRRPW